MASAKAAISKPALAAAGGAKLAARRHQWRSLLAKTG